MDREDVMYTQTQTHTHTHTHKHDGILLSHQNEWNNAIFSNMNEPENYHTKCIT